MSPQSKQEKPSKKRRMDEKKKQQNSGRKTLKVTELQWNILSVADGSRKILVLDGRL